MAKYSIVPSKAGYENAFEFKGTVYVPRKDTNCDTCALIGGYCGMCSGHYFCVVVDLSECIYCGHADCVAPLYGESICGPVY